MEEKTSKTKDLLLKTLFIILIVIMVVILAFAVIRFVPMIFSSLASVGSIFGKDNIEVSVNNAELVDGESFVLFWKQDTDNTGVYNLTYPCKEHLKLSVLDSDSNLNCNTPYRLPSNSNSIELKVSVTKSNIFIDLPLEISFVDNANSKITAKGEVALTVKNISTTASNNNLSGSTVIASEPVEDTSNSDPTPSAATPADLYIYNVNDIDDEKIIFTIGNRGGTSTGNWFFTYDAPGLPSELSPIQPSLRPGSAILYTLSFDGADEGIVRIYVDSTNSVNESSEANNVASVRIDGSNRSYSYDRNDDADFVIEELEVGRMRGSRFVEDDDIDEDDDAAVRFVVVNQGGEETEEWRFEIKDTPYDNGSTFRSRRQDELEPGESVEIIVEFENPDEGRYDIEVEVDSDDDTNEENERNNDADERLRVRD